MTDIIDELAGDIVPEPEGKGTKTSQGLLVAWDPNDFSNVVDWQGTTMVDLPVRSGVDALTYQVGDVVELNGQSPEGGVSTWYISGRIIKPGPGAGAAAVSWMQSSLGEAVARAVIGNAVYSDTEFDLVTQTLGNDGDTGFESLGGPEVNFVTETGKWLMIATSNCFQIATAVSNISDMSFEVTGAQNFGPSVGDSSPLNKGDVPGSLGLTLVQSRTFEGAPGEITVGMRHRFRTTVGGSGTNHSNWRVRTITVIAF